MSKWIVIALLCLLLPGKALPYELKSVAGTYNISSTIINELTYEEVRFVETVCMHFREAKTCWKQKLSPREKTINRIILGCVMAQRKYWPGNPERMYQLFCLIISESGGNNTGNPDDPSYGVCHATMPSAHNACLMFGIPHPKCSQCNGTCAGLIVKDGRTFKEWLEEDILFNIDCGVGELEIALCKVRNDLVRGVAIYKHGEKGFNRALNRLVGKPITELPVWKHYSSLLQWVTCLRDRSIAQAISPCGCMPVEKQTLRFDGRE